VGLAGLVPSVSAAANRCGFSNAVLNGQCDERCDTSCGWQRCLGAAVDVAGRRMEDGSPAIVADST